MWISGTQTIFTVSVLYPTLSGFLHHYHTHKCPNMKTITMQLVRVNCCLNSRKVSIWKCLLYHVLALLYSLLLVFETHRYIWRSDFYLAFQERKTTVKAVHNYTRSHTSRWEACMKMRLSNKSWFKSYLIY